MGFMSPKISSKMPIKFPSCTGRRKVQPSLMTSSPSPSPTSNISSLEASPEKKKKKSGKEKLYVMVIKYVLQDDHYLIKHCLAYDWKAVKTCCFTLLKILNNELDFTQDDDDCRDHALIKQKATQQLFVTDKWGNTPLHVACYFQPPTSIVKLLLQAISLVRTTTNNNNDDDNDDGANTKEKPNNQDDQSQPLIFPNVCTMVNDRNATPIMIAAASEASLEVMQELLKEEFNGSTDTVCIPDFEGHSPFTKLTSRYEMLRRFPTKHRFAPSLDRIKNISNLCQLSNREDENSSQVKEALLVEYDDHDKQHGDDSDSDDSWRHDTFMMENYYHNNDKVACPDIESFQLYWNKINALMHSAWTCKKVTLQEYTGIEEDKLIMMSQQDMTKNNKYPTLFAAAYICETLPPKLADMILRCCHNDDGNIIVGQYLLPLHVAVMEREKHLCLYKEQHLCRMHFIESLLRQSNDNNKDCQTRMPKTQRLPFTEAIASGLTWHAPPQLYNKDRTGPLQMLWKSYPDALYEQDPKTGLPPFLLAAASQPCLDNDNDMNGSRDMEDLSLLGLDSIYSILRMSPEALEQCN